VTLLLAPPTFNRRLISGREVGVPVPLRRGPRLMASIARGVVPTLSSAIVGKAVPACISYTSLVSIIMSLWGTFPAVVPVSIWATAPGVAFLIMNYAAIFIQVWAPASILTMFSATATFPVTLSASVSVRFRTTSST